jgi:hypothetical protein
MRALLEEPCRFNRPPALASSALSSEGPGRSRVVSERAGPALQASRSLEVTTHTGRVRRARNPASPFMFRFDVDGCRVVTVIASYTGPAERRP